MNTFLHLFIQIWALLHACVAGAIGVVILMKLFNPLLMGELVITTASLIIAWIAWREL